jgi:hypothetical protein
MAGFEPATRCSQNIIEQFRQVAADDGWCLKAPVSGLSADRANWADTGEHEPF